MRLGSTTMSERGTLMYSSGIVVVPSSRLNERTVSSNPAARSFSATETRARFGVAEWHKNPPRIGRVLPAVPVPPRRLILLLGLATHLDRVRKLARDDFLLVARANAHAALLFQADEFRVQLPSRLLHSGINLAGCLCERAWPPVCAAQQSKQRLGAIGGSPLSGLIAVLPAFGLHPMIRNRFVEHVDESRVKESPAGRDAELSRTRWRSEDDAPRKLASSFAG